MYTLEDAVRPQYDYAKALGWLPIFKAAAEKYQLDYSIVLGIASRETNIRNIVGDYGHGYGVMQVDIGTERVWCETGQWRHVPNAIDMGCSILAAKRDELHKTYMLNEPAIIPVMVAAYNCGMKAEEAYKAKENVDKYTTGHNYSKDVLERAKIFASFIEKDTENAIHNSD